ncbi:membrane protein [Sulfolobales archaeon HS-7]|nr:membrane protein [Sulfolobales archaeon HS-7]
MDQVKHYTDEADRFRTIVFGIQDGLIGVGALALGIAGYTASPFDVMVAGIMGTIAQAFSMGIGEYISTRVRMQIIENEIKKESMEIEKMPQKEFEELVGMYVNKGFSREEAENIARRIMSNKETTLREMMMEELRVLPEEFEKPVKLGLIMSLYLILGGMIPTIPFMVGVLTRSGFTYPAISSIVLTVITLGIFGLIGTKYTGLPKWRGAMEQVGTGLIALIGSFVAGHLLALILPVTSIAFLSLYAPA